MNLLNTYHTKKLAKNLENTLNVNLEELRKDWEKQSQYPQNSDQKILKGRSLWQNAMRRFFRNKAAIISLVLIVGVLLFSLFGSVLSKYTYDETDFALIASAPSFENGHYFGTDNSGRDLFVRVAIGGQISLLVGVVGALMAIVIGVIYGASSGYIGGKTDIIMMRILEIFSALPFMFLVILLVTFFGQSIFLIFVAIGAVSWLDMARIVRGQTLSLKNKEFVQAALVCGVGTRSIILKHIVPNLLGLVVVYASLLVPAMILFESFLSFLGLGVEEPLSSWGSLMNDGVSSMEQTPWLVGFPSAFLVITLFCFNFIGDGLRDALDPKDR
ncbi:oligopeptide ABC transporter permease OppC [Campylobacter sp. VicNov18]|uniref:oligopeptide ABC transporter permease OppC n=1 Tax=Campylobacter bilis TaxID=2691918 RepID=UPI00130DC203|nr:oligopeptide ABC transporter permease OppC [Campylobacter bilis]MPV64272.1 oligopeptide ABC transporter permease OppC [Campylobacter hepaticus]MBM0637778.1 oligopeptide ABC transporter permease OppC [Campylobacter bilis]MCC8278505.1 oligopeptide ABC transporter permease OppC [Campylobacter bilis]MCC8300008.1 oligopeptide ABC transporter permease OppC [Campylobacter bilis]MCC8301414.1 oligopeptide ABC transporter permease OppC [Campylobacter bilis]